MANAAYPPAMRELNEVETAGQLLGIETIASKIRQAADIAPAFEVLNGRAERSRSHHCDLVAAEDRA